MSASADALTWKEEWPKFRTSEVVVTAAAGAGFVTMYLVPRIPATWGGGLLFDNAVRDTFRSEDRSTVNTWQRLSTVGYYGLIAYPLLIDGLLVPFARGNSTVAAQTTLINLEAFAIAGFLFRGSEALVRRARPYVWDCMERTGSYDQCKVEGLGGTNSFFSGHVTLAATGAALMCTHHLNLRLYGGPWDALVCGAGIAVTGGVAVARSITDNHYATDIITGAIVGSLIGWLVPTAFHYGFDGKGVGANKLKSLPMPTATHHSVGLVWSAVL